MCTVWRPLACYLVLSLLPAVALCTSIVSDTNTATESSEEGSECNMDLIGRYYDQMSSTQKNLPVVNATEEMKEICPNLKRTCCKHSMLLSFQKTIKKNGDKSNTVFQIYK